MREGKWISGKFLLTPLREGRLCFLPVAADDVKISTHAPAGGATLYESLLAANVWNISTHAPAGGATLSVKSIVTLGHFYSRPCGRGDSLTL